MAAAEAGQVRRGVVMVGPPYLYNGSQVCGRRTGRTCIFLLASFGTACTLIGLVFFSADLRMESGLWIAGVVSILLGAVLLLWFLTLCCAARCAFKKLPTSHPARAMPSNAVLVPPRSSTYQLLPMSPNRTQITPSSSMSATQTLPMSSSNRVKAAEATAYPTWSHGGRGREYMAGQPGFQPSVYTWTSTPGYSGINPALRGYTHDCTMTEYGLPNHLMAHTLTRPSASRQAGYSGYSTTLPSAPPRVSHSTTLPPAPPRVSLSGYVGDDSPPPYHTVVSGP